MSPQASAGAPEGQPNSERCWGAGRGGSPPPSAITEPEEAATTYPPCSVIPQCRGPWAGWGCLADPFHFLLFPFCSFCQEPAPGSVLGNMYLRENYIGIKAGWFYPISPSEVERGRAPPLLPLSPLLTLCPAGHFPVSTWLVSGMHRGRAVRWCLVESRLR